MPKDFDLLVCKGSFGAIRVVSQIIIIQVFGIRYRYQGVQCVIVVALQEMADLEFMEIMLFLTSPLVSFGNSIRGVQDAYECDRNLRWLI